MTNANKTQSLVTLPKEVDEVIRYKRSLQDTNSDILSDVFEGDAGRDIHDFINNTKGNFDVFLSALVNGYQVEKSPEDNVRDYFMRLKELEKQAYEAADHETESEFLSEQTGAIMVLNQLGIQIEGVNA